jgi:Zn-dependent protease/CBS domain-containing protein
MKWSIKLGQVAGIGLFVHWTFVLLLGWIAYLHVAAGEDVGQVLVGVAFIVSLFGCVVLHELGHALTARRFGCKTRDITLLPIGGVARLERIPEVPLQELCVAVAGPAVNVVIAAVLFAALLVVGGAYQFTGLTVVGGSFLANLMWVNVALVLFNLLPAFPMDGGRVLRALLAMQMTRVKATQIAASVGQMMAILLGIAGFLSGNWILLFIAFFVYVGAQGEAQAVEIRSIFKDYRVRDAMVRQFQTLNEHDLVADAVRVSSTSEQKDFPVMDDGHVSGLLLHRDVIKALAAGDGNHRLADFVRRDCLKVDDDEPLDRVLDKMNALSCRTLLVVRQDQLVGILSEEHLGNWLMLHSSVRERPPQAA